MIRQENKAGRSLTNRVQTMRDGLSSLRLGQMGSISFISCAYIRLTREGIWGDSHTGLNGGTLHSENTRRISTRRAARKEGWVFSSAGTSMSLRRTETMGTRGKRNPINQGSRRPSGGISDCFVKKRRHLMPSDICTRTQNIFILGGIHLERRSQIRDDDWITSWYPEKEWEDSPL